MTRRRWFATSNEMQHDDCIRKHCQTIPFLCLVLVLVRVWVLLVSFLPMPFRFDRIVSNVLQRGQITPILCSFEHAMIWLSFDKTNPPMLYHRHRHSVVTMQWPGRCRCFHREQNATTHEHETFPSCLSDKDSPRRRCRACKPATTRSFL